MFSKKDPLENVNTKEDFIKFLQDLSIDFDENPNSWQNTSISSYLEAMSAYVEYMDAEIIYQRFGIVIPPNPDWKFIARVLLSGKYYE